MNFFHNKYIDNLAWPLEFLKTPELIDKKIKNMFSYFITQEPKKQQMDPKKQQKYNINYNKNDKILLIIWGYLFTHIKQCINTLCFCHNDNDKLFDYTLKYEYRPKLDNPMKNFESLIYLKYFVRQQYKEAITLRKPNFDLRLNLAYFNFFQLQNFHQALLEAFELIENNKHLKGLNYRKIFLIKRLELEIRDLLQNLNINKAGDEKFSKFNIEQILEYEENFTFMENKINEFRNLYTKFFFKLSSASIELPELESDCSILYNLRMTIQEKFELLNSNPRAIKLYLGYLNNLVFKNDLGYVLEQNLKVLLEKIHANEGQLQLFYSENLIYNENTMLFQVGGEHKNLGKIIKTNKGSGKILGYQIQELELSNISIMMPIRLKRLHDKFLDNFTATGKNYMLYKENSVFIRRKSGYLINAAILVKPSFDYVNNQFKFLGFLRPLKRATEYIITDMYGGIDGMSENLSKLFNVHPNDYEKNSFYIQILCPKLYSFFLERNEKVNNIFLGSHNSSSTNRTNKTRKFKEIQELDLMELLDLPKTLSNEAILRFYRYNDGELFCDLRSIINAIIEKLRKKKLEDSFQGAINPESPKAMDKWNLVKRKFIKIAMLGNFFNCKTKIDYFKSSDHQFEWLVFSITEIEFTKKLKILQMTNKPVGQTITTNNEMNSSMMNPQFYNPRLSENQFSPNTIKKAIGFQATIMNNIPTIPLNNNILNKNVNSAQNNQNFQSNIALPNNQITMNIPKKVSIMVDTPENTNNFNNSNQLNINFSNVNGVHTNNGNRSILMGNKKPNIFEPTNNKLPVNRQPTITYLKGSANTTGIEKIVIFPDNNENNENSDEQENLIIPSDKSLDLEGLVQERVSIPVEEVRKNLDSEKKKSSPNISPRKKYLKTGTGASSTLKDKDAGLGMSLHPYNGGKTFETMNSSDFGNFGKKLLIPAISLESNPFIENQEMVINESMPELPENGNFPMEDEEKMAENIINFTGNQLFEDKSEDMTDISEIMKQGKGGGKKSLKSPGGKSRKSVVFKAKFNDMSSFEESSQIALHKVSKGDSPKGKIEKNEKKPDFGGNVNKEDLRVINKTLKDISRGLTRGVDSDEDSDKKTIKSTKMGARTIKTIKSMNKKTNINVTFTPKTHKLLDVLRETIVNKLALQDNGNKKEKAYEQSVHSSISSIYQSHRLTEKAILTDYVPICYRKLTWSLLFLLILIFVMQISIYLIIVNLYDGFKENLTENINYDRFSNTLLQSLKGIFIYQSIQEKNMTENIVNGKYFKDYFLWSVSQEFEVIKSLLNEIQLNYNFYHQLSPDLFLRKSFYNLTNGQSESASLFNRFPFELLKAVTLYLSEMQKFLKGESYNSVFLLDNIFGFTSETLYHDNFTNKRSDLITTNKLAIMVILIVISVLIVGLFFLRIHSHLVCYRYMNDLLELLAKTNYEDIETLKAYYISIASVYDLQQELSGPENKTQMLGINYLENPKIDDKNKGNNKNRSHKLMNIGYIKIPTFQIVFLNFIFAIFIIGINLIVVLLSHGFDSHFEASGELQRQIMSQFNFKGYTDGYVLAYDQSLRIQQYNLSQMSILDFLSNNFQTNSLSENSYSSQNSFLNEYLQMISNENICQIISGNNITLSARCQTILNGLLTKTLVNFELETFQSLKVMTLDQNGGDILNFLEFGEALDYALMLVDIIKQEYITSETNTYDSEIKTIIIINCLSIICSFLIISLYYLIGLTSLAKRLIGIRKIYLQIPIAILMRQKRIKKYLQDTSKFFLGG